MPVSFVFTYAHPVLQRHRQRRTWEVSVLAPIWNMEDPLMPPGSISHSERRRGNYASFLVLSNILRNILSKG